MSQQYISSTKCCATCTYWTGKRECDRFGQRLTVPGPMERGICGAPRGGSKGQQKQANGLCSAWQKWSILK